MADVPNWKNRRLARRALRIQARRAASSAPIKAYGTSLVPKAQAFIAAYDAASNYEATWKREMKEGRGAVLALLREIRSWAPVVAGSVPTLDTSKLGDKPDVPDDVVLDAETLLHAATDVKLENGDPAPYCAELEGALGVALTNAEKEWAEAEAADSTYQGLLAAVRDAAEPFEKVLVQFRRTLAAVAGRQDKDYQKLRAERASAADDEDDQEPAPGGDASAPAGAPGGGSAPAGG